MVGMTLGASTVVEALLDYAIGHKLLETRDCRWARNHLLAMAGEDGCEDEGSFEEAPRELDLLLDALAAIALANGMLQPGQPEKERFCACVMDFLMPRPSQVKERFSQLMAAGQSKEACDYLYGLSCDAGYVRRSAMARDVKWVSHSRWGDLEMTINCSKPEKDPREIASLTDQDEQLRRAHKYPACQLCFDNEGYEGRLPGNSHGTHPARHNLRIAQLSLGGERWGLQFSPYAYYEQHCIAINERHVPMAINGATFAKLMDFADAFPHYFVGSNADLPIVGGSILNHDHFQAGLHAFPMESAASAQEFAVSSCPQVECAVLEWPVTVLRLVSADRQQLLDAAVRVLKAWQGYSCPQVGIVACGPDGTPHNTVTPICRKAGEDYVLYLALRCNVTSDEHPLGVFHPHAGLHHIKKENIGLIEVMGLAILPGRLSGELDEVANALVNGGDDVQGVHGDWALEVARNHPELSAANARFILREEVAQVFAQVLECAGVFKWDEPGRSALNDFLATLA